MTNSQTAAQAAQQNNRDGGGKYATKTHAEVEDLELYDESHHEALYDVAANQASAVNGDGVREQVAFLRRFGVPDDQIREAADSDELDDMVLDVTEKQAAEAYNGEQSADDLNDDFEFAKWSTNSSQFKKFVPKQNVLSMKPDTTTEQNVIVNGEKVTFLVGYSESVPKGDDNYPAHGYKRGEYYVSSRWGESADWLPTSFETSPFREGEGFSQRDYAWSQTRSEIVEAAHRTVLARKTDMLIDLYED